MIIAIPVKPFGVAKQRLAGPLTDAQRRSLSIELARRTATAAVGAGATPLILSADDGVSEWARAEGFDVLLDEGSNLNEAARSATVFAGDRPWIVCHADLPLLTASDLSAAMTAMSGRRWVLSASSDGGTSLIGGRGGFAFSFGPSSFQRHIVALADREVTVVNRLGTMLDLDTPADLDAAIRHPRGSWLASIVR